MPLDPPAEEYEEQPQPNQFASFQLRVPVVFRPGENAEQSESVNQTKDENSNQLQLQREPNSPKIIDEQSDSNTEKKIEIKENVGFDQDLDPNADSDEELDPNAMSESEEYHKEESKKDFDPLDPNAPSDEEDDQPNPNSESDQSDHESSQKAPEPEIDVIAHTESEFLSKIRQYEKLKEEQKNIKDPKQIKKEQFIAYLSSVISEDDITATSKFKEYKKILKQNESEYKSIKKSKREKYFDEFRDEILEKRKANNPKATIKEKLELLKQKEEKHKDRERKKLEKLNPKEARKREQQEALDNFNLMLTQLITDPDLQWEEASKILEKDARFKHPSIFPERREKLWKCHRYNMFQERKEQRQQQHKDQGDK